MAEPIIEVKGLWTRFGTHVVHRNINLTVYRGEIMSLMFLGLALTEAIVFYALLMGFVAFFIG